MKIQAQIKSALIIWILAIVAALPGLAAAQAVETHNPGRGGYTLVGLGPAGLDLMTPRQLKAIQEADVVFCRPETKAMLEPKVDFSEKQVIDGYNLIFPFYNKPCPEDHGARKTRWGKTCEEFHHLQAEFAGMVRQFVAQGKKVVMTIGGDPTIYSPGIWSVLTLQDINAKVVPGLSAFNAANAALKAGLGEVMITAPFDKGADADSLENLARHEKATMVIFMPRKMDSLLARLAKVYPADMPVGVVSDAGNPAKERVVLGTITDIKEKLADVDIGRSLVYVGRALGASAYTPSREAKSKGKYYLVGLGPGDPDLITLRGLEVIKKADVIFAHRRIKETFSKELAGKDVIDGYHRLFPHYGKPCPKPGEQPAQERRERMNCEEYHQKQAEFAGIVRRAVAEGKIVAMLDSGDPMVYGPCNWSLDEFKDIDTEVVPGMSCFNAANAALGAGVTEGKTSHSVLLASGWSVEEMAREKATMVLFTMRTEFEKFIDALQEYYPLQTPVGIVIMAGYADKEQVVRSTLGQIMEEKGEGRLPFQYMLYVGDALTNAKPY